MSTIASSQLRDSIKVISPPWLQTGNGEKLLYTIGLLHDALCEKANQATRASMPGLGTGDALPYIGADNVLSQGPAETAASFVARNSSALDAWAHAGSRASVLQQVLNYVSGFENAATTGQVPRGVIVSSSAAGTWATWDTYYNTTALTAQPNHISITSGNWNWDANFRNSNAFLILFFESGATLGPAPFVFGSPGITIGTNANVSIGLSVPSAVVTQLRALVKLWKSARTYYPNFIFCFNGGDSSAGTEFSPNSSAGSGNPDGTFGRWAKYVSHAAVPSRTADARYADGVI